MKNENWEKAKKIFADAIKFAPDERLRFLDDVCADDADTRREVESLLNSFDDASSFMESPAIGEVAEVIRQDKNLTNGKCFGHYEIISQIGAGGMGEVYLAKDKKLDRRVAVKILNEKFSRHESNLSRFILEAKAASALNHPNILVIHEIGAEGEANYIVSEFVEGKTLRARFTESPMRLSEALDIAVQIAGALSTAHAARIVHRDIKPENVIVRPDGYVKILDFGLAKLIAEKNKSFAGSEAATAKQNNTAQGVILGTVNYMSPEQAKGERIDERTDIFSFGVLLYEMIAGRTPFAGDSNSETLANLINKKPPPLSRFAAGVPEELTRIVAETLRKKRDERYQTTKDLLADLKALREKLTFEENLERTAAPDAAANGTTAELQAATTGDAAKKQTAEQNSLFGKITKRKTATLAALAFAFIIVAVVGVYFAFFAPPPAVSSVAVLPFENATGDANFDYLSDGLSESLVDRLSQLPELKVIARSSSFKYRGADVDLRNAANRLGVQAVVIGKITRRGDVLNIRVEMIDTRDNRQMWSEQYNRQASDALSVQEQIAQAASAKLRSKLTGAEEQRLTKSTTQNPEAFQLYLKGVFHANKSKPAEKLKAVEYFQQAIALDPNYAQSYVALASVYHGLMNYIDVPPENYPQKARENVLKALALDDQLPDALIMYGSVLTREYDFVGAERELKRAVELNPNLAGAHLGYGSLLSNLGRHEEALAETRRGLELDPISIGANHSYSYSLFYARKYDECIAQSKKVVEMNPEFFGSHFLLAVAYEMKGDYAASVAERVKMNEIGGTKQRAEAFQKSFDAGGWEGFLREATADNAPFNVPPYIAVTFNAALGEKDKAFAILDKLYKERSPELRQIKVDPRLDNLRSDPRFQDLLRRVGLPQ